MKIKKLKKLIAGVLSAAMVMSTMAVTAFAAGEVSTIDSSKKGSLTIQKFSQGDGVDPSDADRTGTQADAENVPANSEGLNGVTFDIYKVKDLNGLSEYYSAANPADLPAYTEFLEWDDNNDEWKLKGDYQSAEKKSDITKTVEDKDGIAQFTGLELGLYVVVESGYPDGVTTPIEPFVVSVPMTNVGGNGWLYDIYVYPKNSTKEGTAVLVKTGDNGGTTNPVLEGVEFKLEKKTADGTWTQITKKSTAAGGDNSGETLNLITDKQGKITVSGLTPGQYRFTEVKLADSDNTGYIVDKKTTYGFTINDQGQTVYDQSGTQISVVNEMPDLDKTVTDRTTGADADNQDTDYNIGDTIPYTITVRVPRNITSLQTFTVTDTPTNLTDNISSVEIKCNDTDVSESAYSIGQGTGNNTNGFVVTFVPAQMADYADRDIEITYNATLLSSASVTTDGNPNTAILEYSNEILPDGSQGTPDTAKIEDSAVVYSFSIDINKTGTQEVGDPKALEDVTFELYSYTGQSASPSESDLQGDDGTKINVSEVKSGTKGAYVKDSAGTATLTTDFNGKINVKGLSNGTYYLVETATNEGYNLLKDPVKVTLNINYVASWSTSTEWKIAEDGTKTLVKHELDSQATTFDSQTDATGVVTTNILNKTGIDLPLTGGTGTLLASLIGILLMGGGAFVFISSRKKKKAE